MNQLGPKLDAIEQAVLGLGPRMDQVRDAVNQTRTDANADADRMVSAIDQVRAAIAAQGPNVPGGSGDDGEGDGPVDTSPLTPGNDGGALPGVGSVVERGDPQAMIGALDRDGFNLTRSCPAMSWQPSWNLGWGTFDMAQVVSLVCWALAILGWMIALAGLIQASFILSQVGR